MPTERQRQLDDLRDTPLPLHLRLAVGPGVRELDHVGRSLVDDQTCLALMQRMLLERPQLWAEDIGRDA